MGKIKKQYFLSHVNFQTPPDTGRWIYRLPSIAERQVNSYKR